MSRCKCSGPGFCPLRGRDVIGREYELCSGRCPPERPCSQEQVDSYHAYLKDGHKVPENQTSSCCNKGPSEPPTTTDMIKSFAASTARWGASSFQRPSPEVLVERERICKSNECGVWMDTDKCGACGCKLSMIVPVFGDIGKRARATEACPKGLWGPALPTDSASQQ